MATSRQRFNEQHSSHSIPRFWYPVKRLIDNRIKIVILKVSIERIPNVTKTTTLIKRQELLDFIQSYRGKYNISPTLSEMAEHIYGDKAAAGNVLTQLVRPLIQEGYLYKVKKASPVLLTNPQPTEFYYKREVEKA